MNLRSQTIREKQMQAYLCNESKVAQVTREYAVEYVKKRFLAENPNVDIGVKIWSSDYYGWDIVVYPRLAVCSPPIASYWVQKFPASKEITKRCRDYQQTNMVDVIFVEFAELTK